MSGSVDLSVFGESNVKNSIQEIIDENNLKNINIEVLAGSKKGDNYLGHIHRIIIKEEHEDEDNSKRLQLIVKSATSNQTIRNFFPIRKLYERELFVYNSILPSFKHFQNSLKVQNAFKNYPRVLKSCLNDNDEYFIMEDQKHLGYVMRDRKRTFDFKHCSIVLQHLGRYHAVSFALKKLQPGVFDNIKNETENIFVKHGNLEMLQQQYESMAEKASESLDPVEDSTILEVFRTYQRGLFQDMLTFSKQSTFDKYGIIIHGDCWGNNILFSYEDAQDTTKPTNVIFLDWQLSYYASPAIDISYFFCNCTDSDLLDKHYDELIKLYHTSLEKSLQDMGCNCDELFPFNALENELRKYFKHGLYMACSNLYYFVGDPDELPDMEALTEETIKEPNPDEYIPKDIASYYRRTRGIIKHSVNRGFI